MPAQDTTPQAVMAMRCESEIRSSHLPLGESRPENGPRGMYHGRVLGHEAAPRITEALLPPKA